VRGDRTVCRSCAGEKYYIPVAPVVLALFLLALSSGAHARQYQGNNKPPAVGHPYEKLEAPVADLGTPEFRNLN
jgi:hypothetical protein